MSLAAEIGSGEARALIDVDVAAVALPRVGALAEEPAVGVDAGAAVGAGVGGAVVGAEAPYDAANDRLHSLHLAVQRTACAVSSMSSPFFFDLSITSFTICTGHC